jgi:tRNA(Arg) A34 adenosine deaminase TadA
MNKSYRVFDTALREAAKGQLGFLHGCLAVDSRTGDVIARSYNSYRKGHKKKQSSHAETSAFYSVPRKLRARIFLVVVRISRDGSPRLSRPCENCQKIIERYKLVVYYTDEFGQLQKF